ncbi:unnamed protein product [Coregonus sp. 'balchen']|nr:unnamed protein product [Coregonus sp. 'balchen']
MLSLLSISCLGFALITAPYSENHLIRRICLGSEVEEGPVRACITSCGVSDRKEKLSVEGDLLSMSDQEPDTLHYAALNVVHQKLKAGRQGNAMERDTVYSGVRRQSMD